MQPNDWENPLLQGWGCRPAHATLMPYPDATTALHGSRFASPFYCSLNEEWQFYLAPNPSVVPTFQQPDYDASNWATIVASFSLRDQIYFDCLTTYSFSGADVQLGVKVTPMGDLPNLPRLGLTWTMPRHYEYFHWFGRGPLESYLDRKQGMRIGLYHGLVDEQFTPYGRPQENDNKTDIRWAACLDAEGSGLLVTGENLNVSVHRFNAFDLEAARHLYELKLRDEVVFSMDFLQAGLGNASCGPGVLKPYTIPPQPYTFALRMRPVHSGEMLVELAHYAD